MLLNKWRQHSGAGQSAGIILPRQQTYQWVDIFHDERIRCALNNRRERSWFKWIRQPWAWRWCNQKTSRWSPFVPSYKPLFMLSSASIRFPTDEYILARYVWGHRECDMVYTQERMYVIVTIVLSRSAEERTITKSKQGAYESWKKFRSKHAQQIFLNRLAEKNISTLEMRYVTSVAHTFSWNWRCVCFFPK